MARHLSLPLFAIRSQPPIDHHHHSKSKKLVPPPITNSRFHRCLIIFSIFSLLIGLAGVISAFIAFRNSPQVSLFPCRRPHDTLVTLKSVKKYGGWISGGGGLADRRKLLGFVGVQTRFSFISRRSALRSTWFPSDPDALLMLEQSTGLSFRFVIGRSKDRGNMEALAREVEEHKDFMLIDIDEDYTELPYKTLEFFKAAIHLFDADYYVKADDNIYMRPDRLATLLAKERTHPLTYIGCMKKGPVVKDPKIKWYERYGNLLGSDYFLHAHGPLYVLSANVVASLAIAKNNSLRMFSNEDVSVGSWMLGMNVHHEDTRAICDTRCTPTSISVWDIPKCSGLCDPVSRVKELHGIQMCSKSPTLPPDDK